MTVKSHIIIFDKKYDYDFKIDSDSYSSWQKIYFKLNSYLYDKGFMFDDIKIKQYTLIDNIINIIAFAD